MSAMTVMAGQFAAGTDWRENAETTVRLIGQAEQADADLLVLPEGILVRFIDQRERILQAAQPLDGPFVTAVAEATRGKHVTVVLGVHESSSSGKPYNTLVVLRDGAVVQTYRKLHLYDAFDARESETVTAADEVPALVEVGGFRVGLMTCYDVRFPELARLLALRGADVLVLPAAWVRGPLKERHWNTLVSARALENTVYVVASGECGDRNIGQSMVVDPLGVPVAAADHRPGTIVARLDSETLTQARTHLPVLRNYRFRVDPNPRPATSGAAAHLDESA